jgi:predicted RecA/RadA family phage recombinase
MARNQVFDHGDAVSVACTDPASPASGDPVLLGQLGGVAQTDKGKGGNVTANTSVLFVGVFKLSVKGVDGSGNHAIAAGDTIFYVTGDTPKLSAKATGVKYGTALDAVVSGATTTIRVRLNGAV